MPVAPVRYVTDCIAASLKALTAFADDAESQALPLAETTVACMRAGGRLLIAGNGGSATDARHIPAAHVFYTLIERAMFPEPIPPGPDA